MALRALIENGSTGIRETTTAEHNAMLSRITYLYQQGTVPVELSVVSSGGNISPNMTDTRYKSGTAARNTSLSWPDVTTYPPDNNTIGEPELVTGTTYDKISQTINPISVYNTGTYHGMGIKPVYRETDNSLREMTLTQVLQYFINPIVSAMQSTTESGTHAGGSYYISTSASVSGSTNLGIVFADTTANLAGYHDYNIGDGVTAGQIYQDVFTTTTYYLQRVDSNYATQTKFGPLGYRTPLVIDYAQSTRQSQTPAGLRHMTYAEFDTLFSPLIKHAIANEAGYTVNYNINGNGTRQGTQIANRQMIGVTGQYTKYEASENDYRAQEFPNGTIVVQNAWDLNLERT